MSVGLCAYFLPLPPCQCFIDLDGPVGTMLTTARDTREAAISQTQPAHYRTAHDNSCLVPAQGQGCSCAGDVMTRRRRGGGEEEGGRDFTRILVNT